MTVHLSAAQVLKALLSFLSQSILDFNANYSYGSLLDKLNNSSSKPAVEVTNGWSYSVREGPLLIPLPIVCPCIQGPDYGLSGLYTMVAMDIPHFQGCKH